MEASNDDEGDRCTEPSGSIDLIVGGTEHNSDEVSMMLRLAFGLLVLALIACGNGSGNDDGEGRSSNAESAMEEYIDTVLNQQDGRAYEWIVIEQAVRINPYHFINCIQENDAADIEIEAVDSYTETLNVAGVGEVKTWAVTARLRHGETSENITRHLIERDGKFYVVFDDESLAAYQAGECP